MIFYMYIYWVHLKKENLFAMSNQASISRWVSHQLRVDCGTQFRLVTTFSLKRDSNVTSVRRSQFTHPTVKYKSSTDESVVDRDANRLDQDYIDQICIDYVQDENADPDGELYNHNDCTDIPDGCTIIVSRCK